MSDICLRCKKRPKRKDYQFCSQECTKIAAKHAPQLIRIPKGHAMYNNGECIYASERVSRNWNIFWTVVKKSFKDSWQGGVNLPTVASISLITWTPEMREAFDKYRWRRFYRYVELFIPIRKRRDLVAKRSRPKHKEVKRFRAERRACRLGEQKNTKPCKRNSCYLCKAIRTAFKSSLQNKRKIVQANSQ
jgi:hypothetical protein